MDKHTLQDAFTFQVSITASDLFILLGLLCIFGSILYGFSIIKQRRAFAEWMVHEGQYKPLLPPVLDDALSAAQEEGIDKQFLSLLRRIRMAHGHDNVKLGHLYWIWTTIEKGDADKSDLVIPKFERT